MLRAPYPAQTLAIMGVSKRWQLASNANVVAECGSGKTLIALGSMLVHSAGRPFSGLVMAPPHLVEKWARETFFTLPHVRVFLIDDMRNGGDPTQPHGINEVRLRRGEIVREGLHTSLTELRRLGRKGWRELCPGTTIFCIGREKAKLSYFWKHCYGKSRSGRYLGSLTNPDTGCPVETDGVRLSALDFEKKRLHQIVEDSKAGKTKYSALWQADCNKIARMAPAEYMGRYMPEWWDYAIADEIHQLAGDTAQGNALGVLNKTARRFLGLTGTLLSGYADDLFNTLFRTDAKRMTEDGYEWGSAGRERFTRDFGVIETIERITVEDNACSRKTKKTVTIKRKPGASPLLFGKYLMDHCAFIGLEDISDGLPSYREEVVPVAMEEPLKTAYEELEEEITACLKEHRGNSSVASTMLNALLAWPDHPYGFGTLYGSEFDPETKCRESFVIAETVDLDNERNLCEGADTYRRSESPARTRPQMPSLCGLHQQARRCRKAGTAVSGRGNTGCDPAGQRPNSQAGSVVQGAVAPWNRCRNLPSQDRGDWAGSPRLSHHSVSRDRLLASHFAPGEPSLVAYRTATPGRSEVLCL